MSIAHYALRTVLPRALSLSILAAALIGCIPRFEQPAPNEPHAVVKLRVVYHASLGVSLREAIIFNGFLVELGRDLRSVGVPVTRAVRVPPASADWSFTTRYFHVERRLETRYVTERHACGTETTGYGQYRSTRTRYCDRQVARQEWVSRDVVDDECSGAARFVARVGRVYVLQYDYFGSGRCSLSCFEQIATGPGTFRLARCT